MKKMILLALVLVACGSEQDQLLAIEDEPVKCEEFCKPSGVKLFEKTPEGNEICMCNRPVKE
jgi:hypothetical protein